MYACTVIGYDDLKCIVIDLASNNVRRVCSAGNMIKILLDFLSVLLSHQ
jgi:hypothetical protein